MRLPKWSELLGTQRDVYEHPFDEPLFAVGPPGSGKTILAIHRAQMLANDGSSVAVITYNRMLRRLTRLLIGDNENVAHTMHAFVWNDYKSRTGSPPIMLVDFEHDWTGMLEVLENRNQIGKRFRYLIVDEGQDLPSEFFEYSHRYVAEVLNVFADEDQALRRRCTSLEAICKAAKLPDPYVLEDNHRNSPEIAAVAAHFHAGRLATTSVRRKRTGIKPVLMCSKGAGATAQQVHNWLVNRGGTIGVVANSNAFASEVYGELKMLLPNHRVDIYDSREQNEEQIELLTSGVTVLNRESVKGQEFDAVFVLEIEDLLPCRTADVKRAMYMVCARARDFLFFVYGPRELASDIRAALPLHLLDERT